MPLTHYNLNDTKYIFGGEEQVSVFTHTVPAGATFLVVAISGMFGDIPSGVTFGGEVLTELTGASIVDQSGLYYAGIWYKATPTIQTADISVSWTGTSKNTACIAASFSGQEPVSPWGTIYQEQGNANVDPAGAQLTTTVDNSYIFTSLSIFQQGITVPAGTTGGTSQFESGETGYARRFAGVIGAYDLRWPIGATGKNWAYVHAELKPEAGAGQSVSRDASLAVNLSGTASALGSMPAEITNEVFSDRNLSLELLIAGKAEAGLSAEALLVSRYDAAVLTAWERMLTRDSAINIEALKGFSPGTPLVVEVLGSVYHNGLVPLESLLSGEQRALMVLEWSGTALVEKDGLLPVEWGESLSVDGYLSVEALVMARQAVTASPDWRQGVGFKSAVPFEVIVIAHAGSSLQLETLAAAVRNALVPYEWSSSATLAFNDAVLPIVWAGKAISDGQVPVEAVSGVEALGSIPFEGLLKAAVGAATSPGWLDIVSTDTAIPFENLITREAEVVIPLAWEGFSIIGIVRLSGIELKQSALSSVAIGRPTLGALALKESTLRNVILTH